MATTTVTVNGFVRAPGTPVTDGNIAVFDTVTGELIADGGKTIAELTVDKSTGGNGAADAGKVLEFQAGGQIQGSADTTGIAAVSGVSAGVDNGVYGKSLEGYGVFGESTNGDGVYGGSINSNGVYAESNNREGVYGGSNATAYAAIKAKNTNAANTAQLALFQNSDDDGLEVTNNGSLDWTLPLAKQQTRVNMLPALAGNAAKVLAVNGAADDVEWVAASGGGGGAPAGDGIVSVTGGVFDTPSTLGDRINASTAKTTPVDADMIGLMDSAASNVLKKLSWANIKATLKTYFDTLYSSRTRVINDQVGTSYTLAATDDIAVTAILRLDNAGAIALTFPLNSVVPIPVGARGRVKAIGLGQVTVTFAGGTVVNSMGNAYKTAGQFAEFDWTKVGTDTWDIDGNLTV